MSDQDPPWRAATDVEVTPDFGPDARAGRAGPDRERGASSVGATGGDLARVREQVTDLREELTARLDEIEVGVRAVVDDRLTALSASLRAELKHRIGAFSDGTARAIDDLTDEVRARVVGELGSLVAALDADGDGLAGRLLAHQDAWERQAEVRVEANTRRVDEVISVLEQTSGALASVQQAVVGLNQQITAVSAHVSGSTAETSRLLAEQQATVAAVQQELLERLDGLAAPTDPDPVVARMEDDIAELRDELLLKQAALAGAVREALDAGLAGVADARVEERSELDARLAALHEHLTALAAEANPGDAVAELSTRIEAQNAALATALREELDDLRELAATPTSLDEGSTAAIASLQQQVAELTALPEVLADQHRILAAALHDRLEALAPLEAQVDGLAALPSQLGEQQSSLVAALREELDELRAAVAAPTAPDEQLVSSLAALQGQVDGLAGLPSQLGEQQSSLVAALREELDDLRAAVAAPTAPDEQLVTSLAALQERVERVADLPSLVGQHQSTLVTALQEEFETLRNTAAAELVERQTYDDELRSTLLSQQAGLAGAVRDALEAAAATEAAARDEAAQARQAEIAALRVELEVLRGDIVDRVHGELEAAAHSEAATRSQDAAAAREALSAAVREALDGWTQSDAESRRTEVADLRRALLDEQAALADRVREVLAEAAASEASARTAATHALEAQLAGLQDRLVEGVQVALERGAEAETSARQTDADAARAQLADTVREVLAGWSNADAEARRDEAADLRGQLLSEQAALAAAVRDLMTEATTAEAEARQAVTAALEAQLTELRADLTGERAALTGAVRAELGSLQEGLVAGVREALDAGASDEAAARAADATATREELVRAVDALLARTTGAEAEARHEQVAELRSALLAEQAALAGAVREVLAEGQAADQASRAAQAEALQQRVIGALAQHLDQATAADLAQRREDAAALVADLAERLEQASAADLVQRQEESAAQLAALRDQLAASTSAQARAVGEVLETQQASLAEQLEQVLASEAAARQSDAAAVRADLVGVVEATLRDANDDESTRRLTEVREMREALMGAQLALADAVRSALADAAAADAAVRTGDSERLRADGEALRSEITHLVEATRAEIDRRLTEITDHGAEQVRADLAAGVARMGDVQAAVMRTELDAVLSSLEPRFDQIAETARVESAVVAGLRSELKEVTERAAAGTVAALRDDVLELRMALNAIQSNGSAATDSLALLRTEGMMELRVRLAEDVEGNLERVAAATRDAIEAANSRTADALRAELAVFQRATEERRDNETSSLDQLVQSLRGEIEGLRATLHTVVAEANTGDAEAIAQLRSELRTVIERTTQETVAALRSDVAGLRTSLGAVELAGAAAADGVAALRAEGGEGLRGTLRSDLESLMTQLGLGLASSMERTSGRSAEAVQEELLAFRRSIGEALQQETRARETALQVVSDELQATVAGLDRKITATLDVGARTERERLDALREDVAAALDDLRTTLREGVADRGDDEALTALRDELRDSVRTLETTLGDALRGDTDAQRAQQRALRDELADALGSVAELVVDTARSEAQSRAAAFDAAGQRIDQLARATAAVVGAQAELRNMLMQLWGQ